MHLEVKAKQLTEEWFRLVKEISTDAGATARERELADRLCDCGRVLNDLLLALHNATVVDD